MHKKILIAIFTIIILLNLNLICTAEDNIGIGCEVNMSSLKVTTNNIIKDISQNQTAVRTQIENKIVTEFEDFVIEEFDFFNRDKTRLYGTVFLPKKAYENIGTANPEKFPFIMITYGTMCINRMYGLLFKNLVKRGYIVAGVDYTGQGFSEGSKPVISEDDLRLDSEYITQDVLDFQKYLFGARYPIDETKMGNWGASLGTVTSAILADKEHRYKAISEMGLCGKNLSRGTYPTWEQIQGKLPTTTALQIEATMAAVHDTDMITPWWQAPIDAYNEHKGPKMIMIHDRYPSFLGMLGSQKRAHHYLQEVIDFFDYFLRGDKQAYHRLIAPDEYCTKLGKAFDFGKDKRDFSSNEENYINRFRNLYGMPFAYNGFGPMWNQYVLNLLPLASQPFKINIPFLLPWDKIWLLFEYWEPNYENFVETIR